MRCPWGCSTNIEQSQTWHGTFDAGGVLRGKGNYLAIDVNKPQAFHAGFTEQRVTCN